MAELNHCFEPILLPAAILAGMYERSIVLADGPQAKKDVLASKESITGTENRVSATGTKARQTEPGATNPTLDNAPEVHHTPSDPLPFKEQQAPVKSGNNLAWLGKFSGNVLVVVNEPGAVHCLDEDLIFLTKVLGAVKLSMDHVAIFNLAKQPMTFSEVSKTLPPRVAIFFGAEPASMQVPMRFPYFQVQPWGGCTFLYAPALRDINGSLPDQVQHKRNLWEALLKIFGSKS